MEVSSSKLLSRSDLQFLLYDWLHAERLSDRVRFADHTRETFDSALDTYERIGSDLFAPHNKKSDQNEPYFDGELVHIIPEVGAALNAFSIAGLMAAAMDYELGGMQLPCVIERAGFAYLCAANIATAAYSFLTIGNANLLLAHGSKEQIDTYVRPEMEGRFLGTMCLSEPEAGSSLADIKTRAVRQSDNTYRIFGNKMWISGGDHSLSENIVHLVLAKTAGNRERNAGVNGISLFIVPKFLVNGDGSAGERNDVVLAGINHKMGYRGTVNTLLNFGEGKFRPHGDSGAIGYLVGEENKGLAYMFHMMNEARIGVGLGAAALGYTGYLHALDYARNRKQGRSPSRGTNPVPIIAHADVKRMLLAQKAYAEGGLALVLYCARLIDEQRTALSEQGRLNAGHLLDLLTPIAKSWPSQWCLEANNLAIQVHGGYGYTRDYNVEQFYRDNRLNPIHEGTQGIQASDLLGRKVRLHDGASMRLLGGAIQETLKGAREAGRSDLAHYAMELDAAWRRTLHVTERIITSTDTDKLANANVYLEAFGHLVVAWIWLDQAVAATRCLQRTAQQSGAEFYFGKLHACRYWFRWELPRVMAGLDLLERMDRTTAEMLDEWF